MLFILIFLFSQQATHFILLCLCIIVVFKCHTITMTWSIVFHLWKQTETLTDCNAFWFVFFSSGVFSDGNLTYGIEPVEGGEVSLEFISFRKHKLQVHLFSRCRVFDLAIRVCSKNSVFEGRIRRLVINHWATARIFQRWSGFISIWGPSWSKAQLHRPGDGSMASELILRTGWLRFSHSLSHSLCLSLSLSPRLSNSDGSFS